VLRIMTRPTVVSNWYVRVMGSQYASYPWGGIEQDHAQQLLTPDDAPRVRPCTISPCLKTTWHRFRCDRSAPCSANCASAPQARRALKTGRIQPGRDWLRGLRRPVPLVGVRLAG